MYVGYPLKRNRPSLQCNYRYFYGLYCGLLLQFLRLLPPYYGCYHRHYHAISTRQYNRHLLHLQDIRTSTRRYCPVLWCINYRHTLYKLLNNQKQS